VGIDVGEALVDFGDARRVRGSLGFVEQAGALAIGGEDGVEQARRATRRFLRDAAETCPLAQVDLAAVGLQSPATRLSRVVLPLPLRPTRPTRCPGGTARVAPSNNRRPPTR
jgi:hypothetical protein